MKSCRIAIVLMLTLAILILAGPFLGTAHAQKAKKTSDWTGFYAGINLGAGLGHSDETFVEHSSGGYTDTVVPDGVSTDSDGVLVGGQFGFLVQKRRFVFGAETDFQYSGMSGTGTYTGVVVDDGSPDANSSIIAHQATTYLGTLRGRIGVAISPKVLLYGTGGLAYGNVDYGANLIYYGTSPNYPAAMSAMKAGWTAGGGVEIRLQRHWSVRGEYLYYDLGAQHLNGAEQPSGTYTNYYTMTTTAQVVRFALNYRF